MKVVQVKPRIDKFVPKIIPDQLEPKTIPEQLDPKTIPEPLEPTATPEQFEPNTEQLEPKAIPEVLKNSADNIKVDLPNIESAGNNMDQVEFQKSATESAATSDERVRNAKFTCILKFICS